MFSSIPGQPIRPAYSYGPAHGNARARPVMLQCPVSAIPDVVFDLLVLWRDCRYLKVMPTITPLVRRAFVIFESEMRAIEGERSNPEHAAALAVAATFKAMGGGSK